MEKQLPATAAYGVLIYLSLMCEAGCHALFGQWAYDWKTHAKAKCSKTVAHVAWEAGAMLARVTDIFVIVDVLQAIILLVQLR